MCRDSRVAFEVNDVAAAVGDTGSVAHGRFCHVIIFAAILIAGLITPTTAAEEPEIRAAISAEEIFVGESVEYQVEIRNSKNPSAPDMSAIKELFDVVSGGDESRNQSSTFIINGRMSKQEVFSHVYHFQLTPKESGDLTIPAAKATIDGKTLSGPQLPLKVVTPEEQDHVLVEIQSSQTKVYPTQPFTVTVRVLVRPLPNDSRTDPLSPLRRNPPHLQINWVDAPAELATEDKAHWLQPLLAEDGIGFTLNDVAMRTGSFFEGPRLAVLKLSKGRESRDGLDGAKIRYFVYELSRTFTPQKTGAYMFGPAVVKGMFVKATERDGYSGERLVAIAAGVTVEVREVPSPRPSGFCGGIGDYKVSASATPDKLRVGDPLTLTVEVQRGEQSGSLELVSAPDLSANAQLSADFDLIDKNPTGRIEGQVKKFAYAMRPRRPNVSIPALTVTTFDPASEQFVDVTTAPIPLSVSEASRLTGGDLVGSIPSAGSSEIKTLAQGIYQNVTDPREVRDERINWIAWSGTTAGIWCLTAIAIACIKSYRHKSSDLVWQRRQQARRSANRELASARTALSQGKSPEALKHVRSALVGFIADMRNRVAEGLTAAEVAHELSAVSVPNDDRDAIVKLLESIESAEYGGAQSADAATAIESATHMINRIATPLERAS